MELATGVLVLAATNRPAAIDAGLDHHARQPVVGVEGPHPDRHGGIARHRERGIGGRFDRHFRGEVGDIGVFEQVRTDPSEAAR